MTVTTCQYLANNGLFRFYRVGKRKRHIRDATRFHWEKGRKDEKHCQYRIKNGLFRSDREERRQRYAREFVSFQWKKERKLKQETRDILLVKIWRILKKSIYLSVGYRLVPNYILYTCRGDKMTILKWNEYMYVRWNCWLSELSFKKDLQR